MGSSKSPLTHSSKDSSGSKSGLHAVSSHIDTSREAYMPGVDLMPNVIGPAPVLVYA